MKETDNIKNIMNLNGMEHDEKLLNSIIRLHAYTRNDYITSFFMLLQSTSTF